MNNVRDMNSCFQIYCTTVVIHLYFLTSPLYTAITVRTCALTMLIVIAANSITLNKLPEIYIKAKHIVL